MNVTLAACWLATVQAAGTIDSNIADGVAIGLGDGGAKMLRLSGDDGRPSWQTSLPGGWYALGETAVATRSGLGPRSIELRDRRGELLAGFDLPTDGEVVLGGRSLALLPTSAHQPGARFDLRFIAFDGTPLGHVTAPGVLVDLIAVPGSDSYLGITMIAPQRARVDLLGFDGRGLFFTTCDGPSPVIGASADGSRMAIAVETTGSGWTLSLLDGHGSKLAETATHPVHALRFARDGAWLMAASTHDVRLFNGRTGEVVYALPFEAGLVPGRSIELAPDASWIAMVSRRDDGESTPAFRLVLVSSPTGEPRVAAAPLDPQAFADRVAVLGLRVGPRDVRVTTPSHVLTVTP